MSDAQKNPDSKVAVIWLLSILLVVAALIAVIGIPSQYQSGYQNGYQDGSNTAVQQWQYQNCQTYPFLLLDSNQYMACRR